MTEESLIGSEDLSCTLPCFEVLDKGSKADEAVSTMDLVSIFIVWHDENEKLKFQDKLWTLLLQK